MNKEEFDKTNEELKEEIEKNNEQIVISDQRKTIINFNKFKYKADVTATFSFISSLVISLLTVILGKSESIVSLVSTIPVEAFPFIFAGGSLCGGIIGRKLFELKLKLKERLISFTTASTESEKLEEEVKYEIQLEKAKNRNKAIKKIIDSLNPNKLISSISLFDECNIINKKAILNKEELEKKIEELSVLLKEQNDELDLLTTQKVLLKKFLNVKDKSFQKSKEVTDLTCQGFGVAMCTGMPLFSLKAYPLSSISEFSVYLSLFAPVIAAIIGGCVYFKKRNKDNIKVFNNLNNELGENALPDKIKEDYCEEYDIDTKIESKIIEISIVGIQLQEYKRALESFTNDEDKKQILEPSVAKEHVIQATKEPSVKTTYNQDNSFGLIDEDLSVDTDMLAKKDEKYPSLVLRKDKLQ